jgi:hypothetical protein
MQPCGVHALDDHVVVRICGVRRARCLRCYGALSKVIWFCLSGV